MSSNRNISHNHNSLKTQPKQTLTKHTPSFQLKTAKSKTSLCYGDGSGKLRHFASTTELVYSPFQTNFYVPPHLDSSHIFDNVFRAECSAWKPRNGIKLDYDQLYRTSEQRYQRQEIHKKGRPVSAYKRANSKIKYLLDQDRAAYQHFSKRKPQIPPPRHPHPDDDLSEESSFTPA